jgi:hypothetical protein
MISFVLYSRPTMDVGGARHSRRWQAAIAVVAAYALFVSLITGSALRSQYSAAAPPEPAAWSQVTPTAGSHTAPAKALTANHFQHASWGASPTNKKPFHSMWMTHDRPDMWSRMQSVPARFALPISFVSMGFSMGQTRSSAPGAAGGDRDILTLLCVARR